MESMYTTRAMGDEEHAMAAAEEIEAYLAVDLSAYEVDYMQQIVLRRIEAAIADRDAGTA